LEGEEEGFCGRVRSLGRESGERVGEHFFRGLWAEGNRKSIDQIGQKKNSNWSNKEDRKVQEAVGGDSRVMDGSRVKEYDRETCDHSE